MVRPRWVPMYTDLEGYYLDGQTPLRRNVRVRLNPMGLHILVDGGETLTWPWNEVHQLESLYGDGLVRLQRGDKIPGVLLVPAPSFFEMLKVAAPERKSHLQKPLRRKNWALVALLSALGASCLTIGLYLWGIPALASRAAAHVPVSWEERLGEEVVGQLAPLEKRCGDSDRAQKIEVVLKTLTSSLPNSPYTFRVIVVNRSAVNAFAAPGGTIVVFRGLLEKTQRAEELAGVLAHEIQHVLHRHATQAMLQQASLSFLLATLVGDSKDMTHGLEGAQALGMMRYSRQYEEEADLDGIRLIMASAIDPRGMIAFFETIQKETEKSSRLPAYLSTHPDLRTRIQRLKSQAGEPGATMVKLLPEYNWRDIQEICGPSTAPVAP